MISHDSQLRFERWLISQTLRTNKGPRLGGGAPIRLESLVYPRTNKGRTPCISPEWLGSVPNQDFPSLRESLHPAGVTERIFLIKRVGLGATLGVLSAAVAAFLWYMIAVPGRSWAGTPPPLTDEERTLVEPLRRHVRAIASSEHNLHHPASLESAARYLEETLASFGYRVASQPIETVAMTPHEANRERPLERPDTAATEVRLHPRNLEVELRGTAAESGIVIVGAHYDSVYGAPGANDNGSGVAALVELARLDARLATPAHLALRALRQRGAAVLQDRSDGKLRVRSALADARRADRRDVFARNDRLLLGCAR